MHRMWFVFVALIFFSASAFADEDARSLFTRGRTQYALGHFKEAAELFEKAFELKQDPAILYNAAQAHRLAGDKKQALVLYQNYVRLFGEMENHEEVERRIVELKAAIEAEQKANTNPPTGLLGDKTEAPPPAVTPAPTEPTPAAVVTQPAPEKPRPRRAWIWGVVAGGVVLVGGAIALGVVFGTTHKDPTATIGAVQAN